MKKVLYLMLAGFVFLGPMGCKKDDPAASGLATAPEADVADDNKSGGIYKGVVIGSTGNIKIVLQGGKKEIVLTLDGVTKTLTTAALDSWTSGQAISSVEFSSGDWSLDLSISADGNATSVGFNIPGHTGSILVMTKEKSFAQVKAFEGTYSGAVSGTWNFIVQGNLIYGASNETGVFEGTISGNSIAILVNGSGTVASGTFSGNTATGTWSESVDLHGAWNCARKM